MRPFQRWCLDPTALVNLTPTKARDLVIECFFDAQKETLSRAKQTLGLSSDEAEMKRSTISIVRVTFKELGHDFEKPTKEALAHVVESLAQKSEMWGTPADVIDHHRVQIGRIFQKL